MSKQVPSDEVERKGRRIRIGASFSATAAQLRTNERMCARMRQRLKTVAPLIENDGDFIAAVRDSAKLIGLYAIGVDIVPQTE